MNEVYDILVNLENEYRHENHDHYERSWKNHDQFYNKMYENKDPGRRIRQVHKLKLKINELLDSGLIEDDFTIIDLMCGDGLHLRDIKNAYPECNAFGVDVFKDEWLSYDDVIASGVRLFRIPIQKIYVTEFDGQIDIVMMLNSYRAYKTPSYTTFDTTENHNESINIKMLDHWIETNVQHFLWEKVIK